MADNGAFRLSEVTLDESIGRSTPDVEHERAVAIFDLIEENSFSPVGDDVGGPVLEGAERAVQQDHRRGLPRPLVEGVDLEAADLDPGAALRMEGLGGLLRAPGQHRARAKHQHGHEEQEQQHAAAGSAKGHRSGRCGGRAGRLRPVGSERTRPTDWHLEKAWAEPTLNTLR